MTKNTSVRRGLSVLAAACLAVGAAGVITIPAAQAAAFTEYASMVPTELTRLVDTRDAKGLPKAPANNEIHEIQVTGDLVPENADAVVINMTAVNASEAGYFVAWPADGTRPSTSNINFGVGDTIANGATVALSDAGKMKIFTRGSADLLIDVAGYYADGTYNAMNAQRALDTRLLATGAAKARVPMHVKLPGTSKGDLVTLNVTVTEPEAAGYVTVWANEDDADTTPSLAGMPSTSNLNYAAGQTIANTVTVEAGEGGMVSLYSMAGAQLIVDMVNRVPEAKKSLVGTLMSPAQRIMDTRYAIGSNEKTGYREFSLLDQAASSDADNVGAAIVNVTVTDPKADGFASILMEKPDGAVTTSVLNFKTGQTIANRVVIPANFLGDLYAYTNVEADVILDVMGYTKKSTVSSLKAAELDLSKATSSTTVTAPKLTPILHNRSAIALSAVADGLYNLDETDHATTALSDANKDTKGLRTWIDGDVVKVVDSSGTEKSVTLVDHDAKTLGNHGGAANDAIADFKLVKLDGLAAGTYTLKVPIITDHATASDVKKATWQVDFEVLNSATGGGAAYGFNSILQKFTVGTTIPDPDPGTPAASMITVEDTDQGSLAYTGLKTPGVNLATTVEGSITDVTADATTEGITAAVVDPATISIEKEATTAGTAALTEAPTASVKTPGDAKLTLVKAGDPVTTMFAVNGTANTVTATTYVKPDVTPASMVKTTVYEAGDAVSLMGAQKLKVKLPTTFEGTAPADAATEGTVAMNMVGTKKLNDYTVPANFASNTLTYTPPARSAFTDASLPLSSEISLVISDVSKLSAPRDTLETTTIKIMLK